MLIVSDTSPIINLAAINHLYLLPELFGRIIIPQIVYQEIVIDGAGESGSDDIQTAQWVEVQSCTNQDIITLLSNELDPGEAEAIALALELNADYLLIDEKDGRQKALDYHLKPLGVLGILLRAKDARLISDISLLMDRLRSEAGFYIHQSLYDQVKRIAKES